jgi:hypothetical protein
MPMTPAPDSLAPALNRFPSCGLQPARCHV